MLFNYMKSIPFSNVQEKRACFLFTHSMIGTSWIQLIIPLSVFPVASWMEHKHSAALWKDLTATLVTAVLLKRGLAPSGC